MEVEESIGFLKSSPKHREIYGREEEELLKIEGIESISHIGSSSIEDILTEDIVDIGLTFEEALEEDLMSSLKDLGYEEVEEKSPRERIFMVKKLDHRINIKLYGYLEGDQSYHDNLFFKELLNRDRDYREEYEKLKIKLLKRYEANSLGYNLGKTIFIKLSLKKARKEIGKLDLSEENVNDETSK